MNDVPIPPAPSSPLTDEDFDRLEELLRAASAPMNVETVDGYFAALICGPELVSPREALDNVLGEEVVFDSAAQAGETIGLLMRHWNTVASELARTLREPHVYLPVLFEDEAGVVRANDWAHGFVRGMQARPGTWNDLLRSETEGGCLLPMLAFEHEHDPDPELRGPTLEGEKRQELQAMMIAGLTRAYRFFEPYRRASSRAATDPPPMRRRSQKVGRNEACPCGSGRKYKHCCAQTSPS